MIEKLKQPEFFTPKSIGEREWGEEILVLLSSGKYTGKILKIKAGKKGGLQYHRKKDEADYVISGSMIVRFMRNGSLVERVVKEGDALRFPPGAIHQTEAITDCVLFEVSTPHYNDRVRVEELLGLEKGSGLPTTDESEIGVL